MSIKKSTGKYKKLDPIEMEEIMKQYSVYKVTNPNNTDIQFVEDFNVLRIEKMANDRFTYIKRTWYQKSDDQAKGILKVDISIKEKVISLFTSNIINPNNEAKEIYDAFVNEYRPSLHFDESRHLVENIRKIKSAYLRYLKNGDNVDIIDYNSLNSTSNSNNINTTIDINNNNNNNNNTNNNDSNENNDMDIDNNNNDSNDNNDMDIDHNIDDDDKNSVSNFGMYK
jgi:hypothetical protein